MPGWWQQAAGCMRAAFSPMLPQHRAQTTWAALRPAPTQWCTTRPTSLAALTRLPTAATPASSSRSLASATSHLWTASASRWAPTPHSRAGCGACCCRTGLHCVRTQGVKLLTRPALRPFRPPAPSCTQTCGTCPSSPAPSEGEAPSSPAPSEGEAPSSPAPSEEEAPSSPAPSEEEAPSSPAPSPPSGPSSPAPEGDCDDKEPPQSMGSCQQQLEWGKCQR